MNQINDLKQIQKIILQNLSQNFDFIKDASGPGMLEDTGRLFCKVKMTDLRKWTGRIVRSEDEDAPLLEALTALCESGRLIIFDCRYHENLEYHDLIFSCEIGAGRRIYVGVEGPKIEIINLYAKKAVSQKQRTASRSIQDVNKVCKKLKDLRDKRFRRQFGDSGLQVESELHRQDVMDEIQLKRRLFAAIEKVERMAEKQ